MPPLPPGLEHLPNRRFSFYPAIVGVASNEWMFRKATWSEVLVYNPAADFEVWIPRRYVGEVSRIEEPVLIVGLEKELEYKMGSVWPYQRRVIQMPVAVGDTRRITAEPNPEPAPVVGIRVQSPQETRAFRMVLGVLIVGVLAALVVMTAFREGIVRQRVVFTTNDQSYLELTREDDYFAVKRKMGEPQSDKWQSETGEIQYRALAYPRRGFTVVLMGERRDNAHYIGTLDKDWRPVHWVPLRSGGSTQAMLKGLGRF